MDVSVNFFAAAIHVNGTSGQIEGRSDPPCAWDSASLRIAGAQLYHALYVERIFDVTTDVDLPAALRDLLAAKNADHTAIVSSGTFSRDGFGALFVRATGIGNIEERRIHQEGRAHRESPTRAARVRGSSVHASEGRQTHCISTQAGCAVRLPISPYGAARIDPQFNAGRDWWRRCCCPRGGTTRRCAAIRYSWLMGQGEPLLNSIP